MELSKLNFHNIKHNFKDTTNQMCLIDDGIEEMAHFLLLSNFFTEHRRNLRAGLNDVLEAYRYSEAPARIFCLNATINYIFETERSA